jgi:hypothetical protein
MKFGITYKRLSRKHEFHENRLSDSHILLTDGNELLRYFPHFLPDLVEVRCRRSLSNAAEH